MSSGFLKMCNSAGVLQGYSWIEVNKTTGATVQKYQALNTTTVTSTLPGGWEPCCSTENSSLAYPMFTVADDPTTLVGWVWLDRVVATQVVTQQYVTLAGSVTTSKPAGWLPGACGSTSGGGGGGGSSVAEIASCENLYLMASMVRDATFYPDWGIPALATTDRKDKVLVPPGYSGGDWTRIAVALENVTAPLAEDFQLELLDLTNSVTVGSITIPSGTSPINDEIFRSVIIGAGSFTDGIDIQWHIVNVEPTNSFGLHAWACYNLVVDTPS